MNTITFFCIIFSILNHVHGTPAVQSKSRGFGIGKQDYGYVTVRPGAHMFWWLYYTTDESQVKTDVPIIMWLAGGPGSGSTGSGNFDGVGLQKVDLEIRNNSWVKDYHVLYVDNPVGAGFSYVENKTLFAKNDDVIASDLYQLILGFYKKLPELEVNPFYVYGNSYGGRMGANFAKLLHKNIKSGQINCNLKGLALGNSWISPVETSFSYGEFLYQIGLLSRKTRSDVDKFAKNISDTYYSGDKMGAKNKWRELQNFISKKTNHVDLALILIKPKFRAEHYVEGYTISNEELLRTGRHGQKDMNELNNLMNNEVKKALKIPEFVTWGGQKNDLYLAIEDFMDPVTSSVEYLLNNTDVKVSVCTGNVDGLIPTPSAVNWVSELKWNDLPTFLNSKREPMWVDDNLQGYKKISPKLSFYWMYDSGHYSFYDAPEATKVYMGALTGKI